MLGPGHVSEGASPECRACMQIVLPAYNRLGSTLAGFGTESV
jgi:hypothetical protein